MVSPPSETSSRTVLSLLLRKSLFDLKQGKGQQGWGREKGLAWPSAAMQPPGKLRASVGPTSGIWERGGLGLAGSPSPQGAAPGLYAVGHAGAVAATWNPPHRPDAEMGAALVARGPEGAGQRGCAWAAGVGGSARLPGPSEEVRPGHNHF